MSTGHKNTNRMAVAMARRRIIKGVLENFLGTYTSRYSDYDGYWLFGFLVNDLHRIQIDLLPEHFIPVSDRPQGVAERLAVERFRDQLQKAGLATAQVKRAWLIMRRWPELIQGDANDHLPTESYVSFLAGAVMDNGRQYERERVIFVAPHNPKAETRSNRVLTQKISESTGRRSITGECETG